MGNAAVIRIVDREDITGGDAGLIVFAQDRLHRLVEDADEGGNSRAGRRDLAVGVGDTGAEIENFVDDGAHRGLAHRREHSSAMASSEFWTISKVTGAGSGCMGHLDCAFSIWMLP